MSSFFETKRIAVTSTAVDLTADPHFGVDAESSTWAFIQNAGAGAIYWRETDTAPAANERGHVLNPGAGIVVLFVGPFWTWSPAGTELQVSPGAPLPTRGA